MVVAEDICQSQSAEKDGKAVAAFASLFFALLRFTWSMGIMLAGFIHRS